MWPRLRCENSCTGSKKSLTTRRTVSDAFEPCWSMDVFLLAFNNTGYDMTSATLVAYPVMESLCCAVFLWNDIPWPLLSGRKCFCVVYQHVHILISQLACRAGCYTATKVACRSYIRFPRLSWNWQCLARRIPAYCPLKMVMFQPAHAVWHWDHNSCACTRNWAQSWKISHRQNKQSIPQSKNRENVSESTINHQKEEFRIIHRKSMCGTSKLYRSLRIEAHQNYYHVLYQMVFDCTMQKGWFAAARSGFLSNQGKRSQRSRTLRDTLLSPQNFPLRADRQSSFCCQGSESSGLLFLLCRLAWVPLESRRRKGSYYLCAIIGSSLRRLISWTILVSFLILVGTCKARVTKPTRRRLRAGPGIPGRSTLHHMAVYDAIELIKGRLYWQQSNSIPKDTDDIHYFCTVGYVRRILCRICQCTCFLVPPGQHVLEESCPERSIHDVVAARGFDRHGGISPPERYILSPRKKRKLGKDIFTQAAFL